MCPVIINTGRAVPVDGPEAVSTYCMYLLYVLIVQLLIEITHMLAYFDSPLVLKISRQTRALKYCEVT